MNFPAQSSGAPRRRRPYTALSASLAALLLATACGTGDDGASSSSSDAAQGTSASGSSSEASQAENTTPAKEGEGAGDPDALSGMSLKVADDGTPTVELDGEVSADEASTRVLETGDDTDLKAGDTVKVNFAAADPKTGEVQNETFTTGPQSIPLDDQLQQMNPEMYDLLTRVGVGGAVAAYVPAETRQAAPTASGASPSSVDLPAQLYVYRVESVLPSHAEGKEVESSDERLPKVSVDEETQRPSIGKPNGEAPDELVVEPLIEGEGAEVTEQDTVTVQYQGVTWSEGEEFDSSWERGTPTSFPLTGVIEGWTKGLAGQKVGSRVLLSVPSDMAYGAEGTPDGSLGKDEDLLFVVDILDASPTPQAPAPEAAPSE